MPDFRAIGRARISAWLRHWGPLLPILAATFIAMLGFGAMIPVLPLFVTEKGIDVATLGLIVAGWAIGKLIFEPVFGWWADSHSRKPQMVLALAMMGLASLLMLAFSSAAALFAMRFVAGIASGMFGPAARGALVEATDKGSRGQAFGYFAAFQMGGFVLGPAIGAAGSAIFGGYAFPFIALGVLGFVSSLVLWRFQPSEPHVADMPHRTTPDDSALARTEIHPAATLEPRLVEEEPAAPAQAPLSALFNRVLISAFILGFGAQLTFGVIDVVWSLYLIDLGASIQWVAVTFILIGLPSIFLAPTVGRYVDRFGPIPFVDLRCAGDGQLWPLVVAGLGAHDAIAGDPGRGRLLRGSRDGAVRHGRSRLTTRPGVPGAGHLRVGGDDRGHPLVGADRCALGDGPALPVLVLRVGRGTEPGLGHAGVFGRTGSAVRSLRTGRGISRLTTAAQASLAQATQAIEVSSNSRKRGNATLSRRIRPLTSE